DAGAHAEQGDDAHEDQQALGRDGPQSLHRLPSTSVSARVLAGDPEMSLRGGKSRVKVAPCTSTLPPWRSAIARTMARPRPEPSPRAPGPRQKRSKACAAASSSSPGPSSVTRTRLP